MKPVLLLLAVSALAFGQVPPMIPSAPDGGPVGGAGNLTTVGAVPYVSATGILSQAPTQLFWDATNNRLGIGTATPVYLLDVAKSGASGTFRAYDQTATTGSTLAVVRAGVAQNSNDLLQWQANNGTTILARVTSGGKVSSTLFGSETNCSSSAGPAVCAAAAAGSVIIPAAGANVTVNTTAVTANSQIFVIFDQSLGTKLGVTCNSTTANPHIGARVAGTSFTIHANVSPVTNPACFSYFIIN